MGAAYWPRYDDHGRVAASRPLPHIHEVFDVGPLATRFTSSETGRRVAAIPGDDPGKVSRCDTAAQTSEIATLSQQIRNLRRTRDLLLPRLLAGQIEVEALPEGIAA